MQWEYIIKAPAAAQPSKKLHKDLSPRMERALWWCYPVPGAAKHPWCPWSQGATSKSTQHPDPHPPPHHSQRLAPPLSVISCRPLVRAQGERLTAIGWEIERTLAFLCISALQEKGRGWRGQRWWCSKIGVIWGFAGGGEEGHGWRDEEEEGEKKVEVSAELCNAAPLVFNWSFQNCTS